MVERSKARTNFVGKFSLGLIEPTKIVLQPSLFPAKISVSGLSPTITAQEGSIPTSSRYCDITFGLGLSACPITLQGAILEAFSI